MSTTDPSNAGAAIYRLDPSRYEAKQLDGELVIVDLAGVRYFTGNRTAALLWPLLEQGATAADLAERLSDAFGIERERAEGDVESFLGELARAELLRA